MDFCTTTPDFGSTTGVGFSNPNPISGFENGETSASLVAGSGAGRSAINNKMSHAY